MMWGFVRGLLVWGFVRSLVVWGFGPAALLILSAHAAAAATNSVPCESISNFCIESTVNIYRFMSTTYSQLPSFAG